MMVNDMTIIYGLATFFILLGVIAPFMNDAFSDLNLPENRVDAIDDDFSEDTVNLISGWKILKSTLFMTFWSFGSIPSWVDAIILLPIRLLFWFLIIRNIRGGGA